MHRVDWTKNLVNSAQPPSEVQKRSKLWRVHGVCLMNFLFMFDGISGASCAKMLVQCAVDTYRACRYMFWCRYVYIHIEIYSCVIGDGISSTESRGLGPR